MLSLNLRRRRRRRLSALRKRSLRKQYTNRDDGHEKNENITHNVDVRPYQPRDDQSLIDVPCGKLDSVFMHLSVKCP